MGVGQLNHRHKHYWRLLKGWAILWFKEESKMFGCELSAFVFDVDRAPKVVGTAYGVIAIREVNEVRHQPLVLWRCTMRD